MRITGIKVTMFKTRGSPDSGPLTVIVAPAQILHARVNGLGMHVDIDLPDMDRRFVLNAAAVELAMNQAGLTNRIERR